MSAWRIAIIAAVVALFIFGKVWVATHPRSTIAAVIGAFLLLITEPSEAH